MEYRVNDRALEAASFLALVGQIWQGDYDAEQARDALSRTYNITAYDGAQPGLEAFYEKNGCKKSMQSYLIPRPPG